ncbi:MAG TPA: DUF5940 domain-containing protein, partial [Thermoleophilaceae bacterium]|nr:DUF5940 domain-containing protein [Thermoleophilaceae bacterium]
LSAHVLIDNLAAKATASLAMVHLLERSGIDPASVDYVIGCGEEAIGDRYQRGGGNLAKAVAEVAGLTEASGADVKNFCAAFVPALVMASSLVGAGVFQRVAIIAGGSLAKLGMKFQGHLAKDLPVLEDVLGGTAALGARRGDFAREEIEEFVRTRGMPGFAPTQGHIASALCYLPHARARLCSGHARRVQLIAKGSLFLGRMSEQSDGMSVMLERNDREGG